jgi:hypothetical protein
MTKESCLTRGIILKVIFLEFCPVLTKIYFSKSVALNSVNTACSSFSVVQKSVDIPVLIGSGVTADNYPVYKSAHALIIGSYFKTAHRWHGDIDEKILSDFMDIVRKDRSSENIQEEK